MVGREIVALCAVGDDRKPRVWNRTIEIVKVLHDPQIFSVVLELAMHPLGRPGVRIKIETLEVVDGQDIWAGLDLVTRKWIESAWRHHADRRARGD